jgi:hypothetical protein
MNESNQFMKRYLLGELSEAEQAALEERYFTDPQVFDEMTEVESDLIDEYVRGRLPARARERFEQFYMAHAKRRERVKFTQALATSIDRVETKAPAPQPVETVSERRGLLESLHRMMMAPVFSLAIVSLLVVAIGGWFFIEARRVRQQLSETQTARAIQEERERDLEQQIADERARADQLAAELEQLRNQQPPEIRPQPAPAFASLLLAVGPGVRGAETGSPAKLVIPAGTKQVRIDLKLKEHDYPSYHVSLQEVGGQEIFSRQNIRPGTTGPGAALTLNLPASRFSTRDYILTLKGATRSGEVEDLSKSLFRVEKK